MSLRFDLAALDMQMRSCWARVGGICESVARRHVTMARRTSLGEVGKIHLAVRPGPP